MSALTHDEMVAEINSGHTVTYRGTKITDVDDVPSDNQIATDTATALQTMAANNPMLSNALVYKGVIDCSANPNYPAADAGHLFIVSVAGKIGGASGVSVEAGDMIICKVDGTTAGTQAQRGASWNVVQSNLVGAYVAGGTDVAVADGGTGASTAANARTNLGLGTLATQSGTLPVKASGAEVDTGIDDAKFITPKALADSAVGDGGASGYLVYTALLTQSGTDAPVATVLENTLGGTVVWTREGEGDYAGTLIGAFSANKTWLSPSMGNGIAFALASGGSDNFQFYRASSDAVEITVTEGSGVLNSTSIEIRVYP